MTSTQTLPEVAIPVRGGGAGLFQRTAELRFGAGMNEITAAFAVPAGVYFGIETVTADLAVGQSEQAFLFVQTVLAGVTARHVIALTELPHAPGVFVATRPVELFADPGTTITVLATRFGPGPYQAIPKPGYVTLSGVTR